jgi:dTDP-4-amino-4,6-dideoxygalactose transaminase
MIMYPFEARLAEQMQRKYIRLVGRGTTALYIALRALHVISKPRHEIILADIVCSVVLDAALLAGYIPIFAHVTDRFTLNWPHIQEQITPHTQTIVAAHSFGHASNFISLEFPVIEDAVQGLGGHVNGQPIGTLGDISFTSFHPTKMIGGYGGLVATDDPDLWSAIQQINLDQPVPISHYASARYQAYGTQLAVLRSTMIRPFDRSIENIEQIQNSWKCLPTNVAQRNEKAAYLRDKLSPLPLALPNILPGDAIWRYTFAAPNLTTARWILRHLQSAGLPGSNLYPSMSNMFQPELNLPSAAIAPRLINLWVDEHTTFEHLDNMISVIYATPFDRLA